MRIHYNKDGIIFIKLNYKGEHIEKIFQNEKEYNDFLLSIEMRG